MRSLVPLSLLLTIFHTTVNAVILPFEVRTGNDISTSSLRRRDPTRIGNTGNAQYVSNITLAGVTLPVLLDTGSSDLWVHFPGSTPPSMKDTGKQATLSYAVGKAGGNIQTAQCQIGNITVEDQAFLNVVDTSTFAANFHLQGYDGLLGLGPNSGSIIRKKVGGNTGNSFLQRVLQQGKTAANYITFLLDRKNDVGSTVTGQFTVNEILTVFSNITSMPKLDVDKVNRLLKADQHWQALTDNDGIIGPDGNSIRVKSIVPNAPKGQFVAVIDSGFTLSQVPREVSDAIYGRVRGAYYDSQNEWWLVPCGQYLNISFNFAGLNYPIHPFDAVDDNFAKLDSTGKRVCIGAFQPITSAFSLLGHYDMILGMSFLRNAYTLLDFGNWVDSESDDHPFIQMLPITNKAAARSNFIQVRLGGNDTISDARWSLLPVDQMQHSPVSDEEKKKKYQEMILSRWPYIFAGCFLLLVLSVGFCIWRCCKKRRARKAKAAGALRGKDNFDDILSKDLPRGRSLALSMPKRQSYVQLETKSTTDLRSPYTPGSPPYNNHSQTSYMAHDPNLPQYSPHDHQDDRQLDYSATHPDQPDYRHSDFTQHSDYSQQSLPQVYHQGGQGEYPQHGAYQQHRF